MPETAKAQRPALPKIILFGVVTLLLCVALGLVIGETNLHDGTIIELRMRRLVLGALAGGGLAMTGAALQLILRNPLADPYILGVSGGSALGATAAILLGWTGATLVGASMIPLAALIGGLLATMLVAALSFRAREPNSTTMLLSGIVVNAVASSIITFAKALAPANKTQSLLMWLTGFLEAPQWPQFIMFIAYVAFGGALLLRDAGRMNLLALGLESAETMGLDSKAVERRILFASALLVGAIVSVTGMIGFVGLLVPQVLRRIVGADARRLLPASFFGGAVMLTFADIVSRVVARELHSVPPVGAVTALVGGPVFLVMLMRSRKLVLS